MSAPLVTNLSEVPSSIPSAKRQILAETAPEVLRTFKFVGTPDAERRKDISRWALSRTRRCLDFLTALFALVLFAPLMLALAVIVQLESDGPAIFMQERMGRNGVAFTLYKFRSMVIASGSGSPITVSGDRRITRIGALLRKFKLDELPQFLNVLKGDMSLVGPRPKLPHHEGLHMPFRPGITGAATLAFRFEEDMLKRIPADQLDKFYDLVVKPRKAKLDWEYMQTATLRTDLALLWKTAKTCLSNEVEAGAAYDDLLPQIAEMRRKQPVSTISQSVHLAASSEPVHVPQVVHSGTSFTFAAEQVES